MCSLGLPRLIYRYKDFWNDWPMQLICLYHADNMTEKLRCKVMPLYLYRSFHSYHAYQLRKDTLMAMPSSVEQLKVFFFLIWKGSVSSRIVWLCHSTCVSLIVTSWSNYQGNVLYLVLTLYYVFHEWVLQKYLKKNYKFWSDLYPDSSEARDLDVRVAGQVGSSHIVWSLQAHTRLSVSDPT